MSEICVGVLVSRPPANRGSSFLDSVAQTMHEPLSLWNAKFGGSILTSLSSTHLLSSCSGRRQCHSCWLLLSRHFQCFRNSSRQFLLMSSKLYKNTWISIIPRLHPRLLRFAPHPHRSLPSNHTSTPSLLPLYHPSPLSTTNFS